MSDSNFERTKFITGIRAYSALFVFLIHAGGAGLRELSGFTNSIVDFGKYGVLSFFVISAFTISMSIDESKGFHFGKYMVRRFLRIAPMYYLVLIVAYFLGGQKYYFEYFHTENSFKNLFMHLSFLNLFDVRYQNSLIGVEWSVPIEFFYYLVIPLIFFLIKMNYHRLMYLFIGSLILFLWIPFYTNKLFLDKFISYEWSVERYIFAFSCGIIAYYFIKIYNRFKFSSVHLLMLIWLLMSIIYFKLPYVEILLPVWIIALILVLTSKNVLGKLIFENKLVIFLGNISYSFYLIHYMVIQILPQTLNKFEFFVVAFILSVIISTISYYFIEKPFISLGRILVKRNRKEVVKQIAI